MFSHSVDGHSERERENGHDDDGGGYDGDGSSGRTALGLCLPFLIMTWNIFGKMLGERKGKQTTRDSSIVWWLGLRDTFLWPTVPLPLSSDVQQKSNQLPTGEREGMCLTDD